MIFEKLTVPEIAAEHIRSFEVEMNLNTEFTDKEYKILNRMFSFLGYENVYHFMLTNESHVKQILKNPFSTKESNYTKNYNDFLKFRKVGVPIVGHLRRLIHYLQYKSNEKQLDKIFKSFIIMYLNKEFNFLHFNYSEFKIELTKTMTVIKCNFPKTDADIFISHLQALSTERTTHESLKQKNGAEKKANIYKVKKSLQFEQICYKLKENNFIENPEDMIRRFNGDSTVPKAHWVNFDYLLLFMLKLLEIYDFINKPSNVNIATSKLFVNVEGKNYTSGTLRTVRNNYSISTFNAIKMVEEIDKLSNPNYKKLYGIVFHSKL